jgi:quercetin dioxygenase-like cupin family protein
VTLKAGDVLFFPAGTIHTAKNVGSGPGAELPTGLTQTSLTGNVDNRFNAG